MKLRLVSWNVNRSKRAIQGLNQSGFDVALLQEAPLPKSSWEGEHCDRGATILQLTDRVEVCGLKSIPPGRRAELGEITVSAPGTIAAGHIRSEFGEPFIAISLYARWERPNPCTPTSWGIGYSDAMAHRAISDLSALIGHKDPATHRILIAGDFNLIHGATEQNRLALPERDRSVFSRLEALGFEFLGPQYPHGRPADPPPDGLAPDTRNVPTYHSSSQEPGTATNQLDYAFASRGFHREVQATALNEPEEWGESDHCRIAIEVDAS